MSEKSFQTKDSFDIDTVHTLKKLTEILEKVIGIVEENREIALKHYRAEKKALDEVRMDGMYCSEDGILEKSTLKALEIVQKSTDQLKEPIDSLTKILATYFMSKSPGDNNKINEPVDLRRFKSR